MKHVDKYKKKLKKIKTKKYINNKHLIKENRYLKALLEITNKISKYKEVDKVIKAILKASLEFTNADRGFIMLCNQEGVWSYKIGIDVNKKLLSLGDFKVSMSVINKIASDKKSIFLKDVIKEKEFKKKKSIRELKLRMILAAPLEINENLIGALYVDSQTPMKDFSEIEKKFFEALAGLSSVALNSAQLYELSIIDYLTGLKNSYYFNLKLQEDVTRITRYGGKISLLLLDLDGFKSINYTFGYLTGNRILQKIGELINNSVRKPDLATRWGGDEFAIICPETDAHGMMILARRIQRKITKFSYSVSADQKIKITVSIGIVSFPTIKVETKEQLIIEAENALFLSKSQGGDKITCFNYLNREPLPVELIGVSKDHQKLLKQIESFSQSASPTLILGEDGTGKTLVANCIHKLSSRKDFPFIVVNCEVIPKISLEDELFGHEKGAFAGAVATKKGKFERASYGTILLREIGVVPLPLQEKILRVINEKKIRRIGAKSSIKTDVRIIVTSRSNLVNEMKKGRFSSALFNRLKRFAINISQLRKRKKDILPIAEHYLKFYSKVYKKLSKGFSDEAKRKILAYDWLGNARELRYYIEKAVIITKGNTISSDDIDLESRGNSK